MNSQSSSQRVLEELPIPTVLGFTGNVGGGGGGQGSSTTSQVSTQTIPDPAKIPLLEHSSEDIAALREELKLERGKRRDNEKQFMECIDMLKKEIHQLNLKFSSLEGEIREMDRQKEVSNAPLTSSTSDREECVSEVVGRLIGDLTDDINTRFEELEENQEVLRVQIQNTRKDLNMSCVQATVKGPSPSIIPASNLDPESPPVNEFGVGAAETENALGMPELLRIMTDGDPANNIMTAPPTTAPLVPDSALNSEAGDASAIILPEHVVEEVVVRTSNSPVPSTSTMPEFQPKQQPQLAQTSTPTSIPPHIVVYRNSAVHGIGTQILHPEGNTDFYCKCGEWACSRKNLQYHIRSASSKVLFQCSICSGKYPIIGTLRLHMKRCHGVDGFLAGKKVCSVCGWISNNMMELRVHQAACLTGNV